MATDVDQICYGRSREELGDQDDSREISVSQMLHHGSISFGRFALEPLSWEKRSVFTHNRYQEELEKFSGLVAQKKAYFEEHYKRIRAMKALREIKHTEPSSNRSDSSGISGQIREDERVIPSKSDGDEMINTISPGVEKAFAATDEDRKHGFIGQDNEEFSKKTGEYVSNDSSYSSSSPEGLEDKLMAEQKKANQAVEGFKGNAFSSEVMEHSFTAGDLVKSELKTKPVTVMLTPILRDSSSQKKNRTVDGILRSKHATIASHTSNRERHSRAATLHPFAFSAVKKAVASIRASPIYDTKKLPSSSSLQLDLKKREKKLENRRPAMVTNRQAIHLKGASVSNAIRPLKARSVSIPTSSKGCYSNVGTNSNRITTNNEDGKRKLIEMANDETCLKKVRSHGKSTIFPVLSRNQNPDNIKMAPPSRIRDLSVNVKNLQLRDNSADRRNPRPEKPEKPEKPRWR